MKRFGGAELFHVSTESSGSQLKSESLSSSTVQSEASNIFVSVGSSRGNKRELSPGLKAYIDEENEKISQSNAELERLINAKYSKETRDFVPAKIRKITHK
jgi:hypothetical protein